MKYISWHLRFTLLQPVACIFIKNLQNANAQIGICTRWGFQFISSIAIAKKKPLSGPFLSIETTNTLLLVFVIYFFVFYVRNIPTFCGVASIGTISLRATLRFRSCTLCTRITCCLIHFLRGSLPCGI